MGIRENLIINFESKTLEYQNKRFYILKQFDYEGRTYLYGIDVDAFNKDQENLEVAFLYRMHDDIFNHVSDKELANKLLDEVAGLCTADMIKRNLNQNSGN